MKNYKKMFTNLIKSITVLLVCFTTNYSFVYAQENIKEYPLSEKAEYIAAFENIPNNIIALNDRNAANYYNYLGEECLKNNDIPCAVLNFSKAIKAAPGIGMGYKNLELAESKVKEKPEKMEDSFNDFFEGISGGFTSIGWFNITAIPFGVYLLCLIFKIPGFYKFIFLAIGIFNFSMGLIAYQYENRVFGVVFEDKVLRQDIQQESQEIRLLYEGTKIQLMKVQNNEIKIKLSDGTIGWLNKEHIEIIN